MFKNFKINIFGASHAEEIGVEITGFPLEKIDLDYVQAMLNRRKASVDVWSTSRGEGDVMIVEEGVENGEITGVLRAVIKNTTQKSSDYDELALIPRPSHADYAAYVKFGLGYDMRGGGKFSGRMTAPLVIAGGIAKYILEKRGVKTEAKIVSVGGERPENMAEVIARAKADGDSVGGTVECVTAGYPAGLGDALFEGLEGKISQSVFAIPAVKAVEFGLGTGFSSAYGSTANDPFIYENGTVVTSSNNNGGINGGISNGMPIVMRATFKPVPSISKKQQSVNLSKRENVEIEIQGRHDACIVPRALPVVEAAVSLALLDEMLNENFQSPSN